MKVLMRILFWPLGLIVKFFFGLLAADMKKAQKRIEQAHKALEKDDGETLKRLYDQVREKPTDSGFLSGLEPRQISISYGTWLHKKGRYSEAEPVWNYALEQKVVGEHEKIEIYFRLADCILGLDQPERLEREALRPIERIYAQQQGDYPPSDDTANLARYRYQFLQEARLRRSQMKQSRFLDLELAQMNAKDFMRRFETGMAYYNAGKMTHALRHMEKAVEYAESDGEKVRANTMAGWWLRAFGETLKAEDRHRTALELAQGNPELEATAVSSWAAYLIEQGRFTELEPFLVKVEKLAPHLPSSWNVLADHETLWGRYDKARECLHHQKEVRLPEPFFDRRHQAGCNMALVLLELNASYYGEAANLSQAREWLHSARRNLEGDARLTAWVDAFEMRLSAFQGDEAAARTLVTKTEAQFSDWDEDPTGIEMLSWHLAGTLLTLEDYSAALPWAQKYLDSSSKPVYRICMQELMARIQDGLGNSAEARRIREELVQGYARIKAVEAAKAH